MEVPMLDALRKEAIESFHESGWDFEKSFTFFKLEGKDKRLAEDYWLGWTRRRIY
jgi:hypothetical protein